MKCIHTGYKSNTHTHELISDSGMGYCLDGQNPLKIQNTHAWQVPLPRTFRMLFYKEPDEIY